DVGVPAQASGLDAEPLGEGDFGGERGDVRCADRRGWRTHDRGWSEHHANRVTSRGFAAGHRGTGPEHAGILVDERKQRLESGRVRERGERAAGKCGDPSEPLAGGTGCGSPQRGGVLFAREKCGGEVAKEASSCCSHARSTAGWTRRDSSGTTSGAW